MMKATFVAMAAMFAATPAAAGSATAEKTKPEVSSLSMLDTSAAPYVYLRNDIMEIESAGLKDAKSIRNAHHLISSYEPTDFASSFVAYAALVAADTPAFASAIEKRTNKKRKRAKFLNDLLENPAMVRDLEGSSEAINAILDVLARDATRISKLGDQYIDQAYQLQKLNWARKKLPQNGMARVRGAAAWAESREWPSVPQREAISSKAGVTRPNLVADQMWTSTWSSESAAAKLDPKANVLVSKALVLAARYAVGDMSDHHMTAYASSKKTNRCFKSAQLMLDQCMAATRTPYEEAFCIGTHGLHDVSRCVGWPASAGSPK